MEEDIKILEEFINNNFQKDKLERNEKGGFKIGTIYKTTELNPALEKLIKGYGELEYKYNKALTDLSIEAKRTNEENYRCSLFAVENNDLKEKLADSIPKSKFREKMEELDNMIKEINKRKTSKVHSRRDYSFKEIFTRTYGGIVWKKNGET